MGAAPPTWWCPICQRFRGFPAGTNPMLLMMVIQRYQDEWGIGDYRIDSADVSNALPRFLSEGPCPHDPFAAVLNRFDMKLK
jgi:hypothetical protein